MIEFFPFILFISLSCRDVLLTDGDGRLLNLYFLDYMSSYFFFIEFKSIFLVVGLSLF